MPKAAATANRTIAGVRTRMFDLPPGFIERIVQEAPFSAPPSTLLVTAVGGPPGPPRTPSSGWFGDALLYLTSRWRNAFATASDLECTCSFPYIFCMWKLIVLKLTLSSPAAL